MSSVPCPRCGPARGTGAGVGTGVRRGVATAGTITDRATAHRGQRRSGWKQQPMSMIKRSLLWLGLGSDEAYEGYVDEPFAQRGPLSSGEFVEARAAIQDAGNVHHLRTRDDSSSSVRTLPMEQKRTVRTIQPAVAAKPYTVSPTSFNDAPELADRFMANQPVIVNLQGVDAKVARRIIDFASGLCYGKEGQMERITSQVYLLTPSDVEVSAEDRRRLEDDGPLD